MRERWHLVLFALAFFAGVQAIGAPGRPPVHRKGKAARALGEVPTTAAVGDGPTLPGASVYPAQTIPLKFSHSVHLAKGIDCTRCHTNIEKSRRASELNFPRGVTCDECHGKQHPRPRDEAANCSFCHTSVDQKNRVTAGLRAPPPVLRFNHQLHLQKGSSCEDCHGDMTKVRLATTMQLPSEADCLKCHDGFAATNRCGACHPTQASGQLVTRQIDDRTMPPLMPRAKGSWGAAHDLTFVEDHAGISKSNPKLCAACHDDTFCTDCHAGAIRPMRIHAGDYLTTHALDARARTQDCQACHRTQSFCLGCHERMGFGERGRGEFGVGGGLQFHPAGWSGPPGARQSHAHAAQRNMAACASCHTEDSCLACHATTSAPMPGLGVNPHGQGFRGSAKCNALASRNRRVCLRCHPPGDRNLDCG